MVVRERKAILGSLALMAAIEFHGGAIAPMSARAVNDATIATQHPATQKVEDSADGWVWTGMSECLDPQMSGGGGHAGPALSSGAYTFYGSGVQLYCVAGPSVRVDSRIRKMGSVKVSIDGQEKDARSVFLPQVDYMHKAFAITGLEAKNHVIEIKADGGAVLIDYLTVLCDPTADLASDGAKTPARTVIAAGDYYLFPLLTSKMCLDVEQIRTADGTNTMLCDLNRGPNQIWRITSLGKDTYRLSPKNAPDSALTVLGPSFAKDGVPVVGIWKYAGAPNQIWKITSTDGQQFRLAPLSDPAMALGVEDGVAKNTNRMELYKYSNPGAQLYWVVPSSRI